MLNYSRVIEYGKKVGVRVDERSFRDFGILAEAHGYSQTQSDVALQYFLHVVSPMTYGVVKRIKIGLKFIAGKI